jgi:uncharacterized protein
MVALLLAKGARLEARGDNGEGPLHDAALGGSPEVITLLLDHGAAIDAPDRESGATPLMIAASLGRAGAVAVLLRRGANPQLRDHAGHTALDRAREAQNNDVVKLLKAQRARIPRRQPERNRQVLGGAFSRVRFARVPQAG